MTTIVRITLTDGAGRVTEELVLSSEAYLTYEIESFFRDLAEIVNKKLNPVSD